MLQLDAEKIEHLANDIDSIAGRQMRQELVRLAYEGKLAGVVVKPPRFSASTIEKHDECPRKYYWPTVAGIETPATVAQAFGTELHKHIELWLKQGIVPPAHTPTGFLANRGLPMLPQPKAPGLHIEEQFEIRIPGVPVPVTGTIDLWRDPQFTPDMATSFDLGDHKTKKDTRFPKTKAWLSNNIQSNLYAYVVWQKLAARGFTRLSTVKKQWNYFHKAERTASPLRIVDSLSHVGEQVETRIKPNLLAMARMVHDTPKVSDVPYNRDACSAYGGCPHQERCWGKERKGSAMGIMSAKFGKAAVLEKVSAAKGAGATINPPKLKAAPPPEPEETETETPEEVPEQVAVEQKKTRAKAQKTLAKAAKQLDEALSNEAPAEAEEQEAPAAKKSASRRAPGYNSKHNFWLFYGCAPTAGFSVPVTHVEKIVGDAQANAGGDGHYRQGNSYGALEASFAQWLEENALVGAVVVDPASIVSRDVVGLLRAFAAVVVERFQ